MKPVAGATIAGHGSRDLDLKLPEHCPPTAIDRINVRLRVHGQTLDQVVRLSPPIQLSVPMIESPTRRVHKLGWWIAGALVIALAASLWQYHRATRASVPEVAAQAALSTADRAVGRAANERGRARLPTAGRRVRAHGGSTFEVGGRQVAAVVFGRGEQRLTYAIVAGAKHVNYYDRDSQYMPGAVYVGKRELNWYDNEIVVVKRNSRTVVITGTPASDVLRRAMKKLALRFPA